MARKLIYMSFCIYLSVLVCSVSSGADETESGVKLADETTTTVKVKTATATEVKNKNKVIATVNGESVYVKDFDRALAFNFKRDPNFRVTPQIVNEQLSVLIDQKLLIQEAQKKRLDRTDKFVNTIKNFWEQTLIRDLLDEKDKELTEPLGAGEDEIKRFYSHMAYKKTFQLLAVKDKTLAEEYINSEDIVPEDIKWEQTIGPIGYAELQSEYLKEAFDLPVGEMKMFDSDGIYFLCYVKAQVDIPLKPFDEMKEGIAKRIKDIKKFNLIKKWLEKLRQKSDIVVNSNVLKTEQSGYEKE